MNQSLRYELKLVCQSRWISQAKSWIRMHPAGFVTTFPTRQVNNLYLDTIDFDCLNANLAGNSRRNKLRIRWYGPAEQCDEPWLEIKRKQNLLGDKLRVQLSCSLDLSQPWHTLLEAIRRKAPADWQWRLKTTSQPTLHNRYQREYFATRDGIVRATLDYAQFACDQRFSPRPNLDRPLPIGDRIIIELKAPLGEEERLQETVGHFPIPRIRNSKYAGSMLAGLLTQ